MIYRIIIFLIINFGALAIGGIFTGKGVPSEWYQNLDKAPWTPPGWMFGLAWTTIMICFSIYMAYLYPQTSRVKLLLLLFITQWILNVAWNPSFFYFQNLGFSMLIIISLSILVAFIMVYFYPILKIKSLFLLPYFIWLLIASSLNFYIWIKN